MLEIQRKSAIASVTIALALAGGLSGCAPRVVAPVGPVGVSYEQEFLNQARYQGEFDGVSDSYIWNLGNQVCTDLDTQPENVSTIYFDYFVTLSVQYICPEHQQTLYQLGY